MKKDRQLQFLYSAISDAQELIKYTESKIGFVIGIITAYVAVLFLTLENTIKYSEHWSCAFWLLYLIVLVFIAGSIWLIAIIIIPVKNPTQCIDVDKIDLPKIDFFLSPNTYNSFHFPFFNSKKFRLKKEFSSYLTEIKKIDDEDIIDILTIELFKISFIRNLKNDRLNILIVVIFFASIFLIIFYLEYQIELKTIQIL